MLDNFKVKNYKNLTEISLSDLKRVNLIIGNAEVGKKNLMEAIAVWLCQEQKQSIVEKALPQDNKIEYPDQVKKMFARSGSERFELSGNLRGSPPLTYVHELNREEATWSINHQISNLNELKGKHPVTFHSYRSDERWSDEEIAEVFEEISKEAIYLNILMGSLQALDSSIKELEIKEGCLYTNFFNGFSLPFSTSGSGIKNVFRMMTGMMLHPHSVYFLHMPETSLHVNTLRYIVEALNLLSIITNNQLFFKIIREEFITQIIRAKIYSLEEEITEINLFKNAVKQYSGKQFYTKRSHY